MELISKDYVVELLNRKQLELDGWGDTEAAMEVGTVRIVVANAKADVTIPDNPTNGDVFRNMFPLTSIMTDGAYVHVEWETERGKEYAVFKVSWWNAPYKGVNDESNN